MADLRSPVVCVLAIVATLAVCAGVEVGAALNQPKFASTTSAAPDSHSPPTANAVGLDGTAQPVAGIMATQSPQQVSDPIAAAREAYRTAHARRLQLTTEHVLWKRIPPVSTAVRRQLIDTSGAGDGATAELRDPEYGSEGVSIGDQVFAPHVLKVVTQPHPSISDAPQLEHEDGASSSSPLNSGSHVDAPKESPLTPTSTPNDGGDVELDTQPPVHRNLAATNGGNAAADTPPTHVRAIAVRQTRRSGRHVLRRHVEKHMQGMVDRLLRGVDDEVSPPSNSASLQHQHHRHHHSHHHRSSSKQRQQRRGNRNGRFGRYELLDHPQPTHTAVDGVELSHPVPATVPFGELSSEHHGSGVAPPVTPPNATTYNTSIAIANFLDSQFYGEFLVGTPPQRLTCVYDSGSANLIVFSANASAKFIGNHTAYAQSKSSTHISDNRKFSIVYGTGSAQGFVSNDTVSIGGLSVVNQAFGEITGGDLRDLHADAIMGLGFPLLSQLDLPVPFDAIARANHLPRRFSFYLARHQATNQSNPEVNLTTTASRLFIGGRDDSLVVERWHSVPLIAESIWLVGLSSVLVGHTDLCAAGGTGKPCVGIVDTGTSFIGVPHNRLGAFIGGISAGHRCVTVPDTEYLNCDCSHGLHTFPTLEFNVMVNTHSGAVARTVDLRLAPEDYFHVEHDDHGHAFCVPLISGVARLETSYDVFLLGDTLLRAYVTEFDMDNQRLTFGRVEPTPPRRGASPPPLSTRWWSHGYVKALIVCAVFFVVFGLALFGRRICCCGGTHEGGVETIGKAVAGVKGGVDEDGDGDAEQPLEQGAESNDGDDTARRCVELHRLPPPPNHQRLFAPGLTPSHHDGLPSADGSPNGYYYHSLTAGPTPTS